MTVCIFIMTVAVQRLQITYCPPYCGNFVEGKCRILRRWPLTYFRKFSMCRFQSLSARPSPVYVRTTNHFNFPHYILSLPWRCKCGFRKAVFSCFPCCYKLAMLIVMRCRKLPKPKLYRRILYRYLMSPEMFNDFFSWWLDTTAHLRNRWYFLRYKLYIHRGS
jgi:hypothetical protein